LLAQIQKALVQGSRLQKQAEAVQSAASSLATLTEREHEVMLLAVAGDTSKEIAQYFGISYRTVEIHRAHVMQKTGATNMLELARIVALLKSNQAPQ
jgi:FixJ family two-component response regulator